MDGIAVRAAIIAAYGSVLRAREDDGTVSLAAA